MKKITTALLALTFLFSSCSKKPLQVTPLENTSNLDTKGMVYTLPRTVFVLKVESEKRVIIPGPYAKYAQKFLGIADVPLQRSEEWKIINIDLKTLNEADPACLFAVSPGNETKIDFLKLMDFGLIIPIHSMEVESINEKNIPQLPIEDIWFKDLSPEQFIGTQKASFYTKVQQDSSFVKVPVQKEIMVEKNLEEKAREASDFIFSIRKRRSDFLTVDADHNLNGDGLKVVMAELEKLEEEYLSLFIGKSYTTGSLHFFDYIPLDAAGETAIVFRFSNSKGVLPPSDLSGNPILLKVDPEKIPDSYKSFFDNLSIEKEKPLPDMVYYRIPLNCGSRITDGKTDLVNRRVSIYQFGPIVRIPAEYLINDNGFIKVK